MRGTRWVIGGALASFAFAACGFDERPAPAAYALAAGTQTPLADAHEERAALADLLTRAFGTPSAPGDASFDGEPPFAWSDELRAQVRADNEEVFARDLERIRRGALQELVLRTAAPELRASMDALAERYERAGDDAARAALREEARETLLAWTPSAAESAELYRQQCAHCHGFEGGGDGPTAQFLEPRPRDVRLGIFKFTALKDQARPRREDLARVLEQGLLGTAMPSFKRFSRAEREGLVDYVRHLALRGELERRLVGAFEDEGEFDEELAREELLDLTSRWERAPEKLVSFQGEIPAATSERIERGRVLFNDARGGNCASCHGVGGAGDGAAVWVTTPEGRRPAYHDAWGEPSLPRNLRTGLFRGGARPIDLYRRIYAGIPGTPMPAMGEMTAADGTRVLSDDDLWSLVHYVRSLAERSPGVVRLTQER